MDLGLGPDRAEKAPRQGREGRKGITVAIDELFSAERTSLFMRSTSWFVFTFATFATFA